MTLFLNAFLGCCCCCCRRFKLGDFGLAIDTTLERSKSRVGTLDYMSPEVRGATISLFVQPTGHCFRATPAMRNVLRWATVQSNMCTSFCHVGEAHEPVV